ncbi:murein L,D-transpeptidase family protein [Planctomycetota bacterium]
MRVPKEAVVLGAVGAFFVLLIILYLTGDYAVLEPPVWNAPVNRQLGPEELKINAAALTIPLPDPEIHIYKEKRRLELIAGKVPVRIYRIGLGFNPQDDKRVEGDGCTPEGEFYICVKNEKSRYYLSLGISYPGIEDAQRGLQDGSITQAQHDAIIGAIEKGGIPPWKTPLGGEIFIHGNGSHRDWTLGCIALDDADIEELFKVIPIGAPIFIRR